MRGGKEGKRKIGWGRSERRWDECGGGREGEADKAGTGERVK